MRQESGILTHFLEFYSLSPFSPRTKEAQGTFQQRRREDLCGHRFYFSTFQLFSESRGCRKSKSVRCPAEKNFPSNEIPAFGFQLRVVSDSVVNYFHSTLITLNPNDRDMR